MAEPFSYAVLRLVDAGTLQLDAPVSRYLPGDYSADPRAARITIRQALTHTTGFPNWRSSPRELPVYFDPGERFSYSGEGFEYLQHAVERVTGQTLDALMRRLVFDPLNMKLALVWQISAQSRSRRTWASWPWAAPRSPRK